MNLDTMITELIEALKELSISEKIDKINVIKEKLHEISPFRNEPIDLVKWVKSDLVVANDYNPNKVAPPEMELLEISILNDGYTQPIVSWFNENGNIEVVDGFHRNRVGKESKLIRERIMGYLPVVNIRTEQSGKSDRIASTIRHNRARGKHQVSAMSEIVIELKNRNWTNQRIAKQLGMDEEEILRLCQLSGIEDLFSDSEFSKAWEATDDNNIYDDLTDEVEEQMNLYRIPHEKDDERIYHTYDKWECYKSGFYKSTKEGMSREECEEAYAEFLRNDLLFREVLQKVITEWKYSCEHYLTNNQMNRIAWLGQAAMCYYSGVPSVFCSGFNKLTEDEQNRANETAFEYLQKWRSNNGYRLLDIDEALLINKQVELY